jgi:hypothetical protein
MTEGSVRNWITGILVLGHWGIILLVWIFKYSGGYTFEEAIAASAIVGPMVAFHSSALFKRLFEGKSNRKQAANEMPSLKAFLMLGSSIVFIILIILVVSLYAFNIGGLGPFWQVEVVLLIQEGVYGAYLGRVVDVLLT